MIICESKAKCCCYWGWKLGNSFSDGVADNGHEVRLWGHKQDQIEEINQIHTNNKYLPDIHLPDQIKGYSSLEEAIFRIRNNRFGCPDKSDS